MCVGSSPVPRSQHSASISSASAESCRAAPPHHSSRPGWGTPSKSAPASWGTWTQRGDCLKGALFWGTQSRKEACWPIIQFLQQIRSQAWSCPPCNGVAEYKTLKHGQRSFSPLEHKQPKINYYQYTSSELISENVTRTVQNITGSLPSTYQFLSCLPLCYLLRWG